VMVHAARWSSVENLHRGVRRSSGEIPVVARTESAAAAQGEADDDPVFEKQRRPGRGNGNQASTARRIEIDEQRAVLTYDSPALIPSADAGVPRLVGAVLRTGREGAGRQ